MKSSIVKDIGVETLCSPKGVILSLLLFCVYIYRLSEVTKGEAVISYVDEFLADISNSLIFLILTNLVTS